MIAPEITFHRTLVLTAISLLSACTMSTSKQPTELTSIQEYERQSRAVIQKCTDEAQNKPQVVEAESITVHVEICVFYSGDGFRPLNPKKPTADELNRLVGGEVYFVAFLKDGSNLKDLEIKSDILGRIRRSEDAIFSYDLYQGSPSDRLEINIGVFDDDGWPSDRVDKLKMFQENLGAALEMFPAAAPGIPFIQPILNAIIGTVDFLDPDDSLISSKVFIEKRNDLTSNKRTWHLYHPFISTDNGSIFFSISPRNAADPGPRT